MTIPASLPVTSLYGGILGVAFALTNLRVGLTRAESGEHYGAGPNTPLNHKVRSAGTIGELGFPGLLLLALLEYNSVLPHWLLWWVGLFFTVTRLLHSFQLANPDSVPTGIRSNSFLATVLYLILASAALIFGKAKN